jgi:putative NADH-flavin reductase
MIVTIFGATGTVGKQLVKQALFAGYTVRAYGRNVFDGIADEERHEHLVLIKGGLFDAGDVEKAIDGADFVCSAIGGGIDSMDNTRSLGMKFIVAAMQKKGVKRIMAVGGMGCLQADDKTQIWEKDSFPEEYQYVTSEHVKALGYLMESKLNWTFVCAPDILKEPVTGTYQTKKDYPAGGLQINAGDLAHFMLTEAIQNNFVKCKVGIGN